MNGLQWLQAGIGGSIAVCLWFAIIVVHLALERRKVKQLVRIENEGCQVS